MSATIQIFNDGQRVAKTSRAFDCNIVHELMRMYTLSFSVANNDPARRYIQAGAQFICDGQAYDIQGYKKQSGSNNTTSVTANHVGYRLNNYKLAARYSFVGTVAAIAADILDLAVDTDGNKASTEFVVGTTPDLGTISFSLNNTSEVTAKYAIMALKNFGAESDFDNFTINFAETIGSGNSETFEYGVNMDSVSITYDTDNGTTCEIGIADLQQIPGHVGNVFDVGDTVTVIDSTTGESFSKRIIKYDRCIDDPTKNKITLGVFVSDVSTQTASMSIDVSTAQSTADSAADVASTSLQQGEQYSNVSIDHTNGFVATNAANDLRVISNANDCFALQKKVDGTWTTIQALVYDGLGATKLFQPGYTGAAGDVYLIIGDSGGGGVTKSLELHRLFLSGETVVDEQILSMFGVGSIVSAVEGNTSHNGRLAFTSLGADLIYKGNGGRVKVAADSAILGTFNDDTGTEAYISISSSGTISLVRNGTTLQTW